MALKAIYYPVGTKDNPINFDSLFIPYIYREIYFEGVYNDVVTGRDDMVVVDVGANIGIVTQYLKRFSKKVYSIEPSKTHFEALKANKEKNGWNKVEIFNFAIADKDGEMILNTNNQNLTCNSLTLDYKQGGEKVETKTFSTFFKENNIKEVDFVKFDVEGAEDMILLSDDFRKVANKIRAIEVEFHFPTFPKIVKRMIELGYEARRYNSSAVIILFTKK